jgi:hypothetical protein
MMSRMYSKLLSRIIWACPHQFSWPRREESGAYYQLCLVCGSKYQYDWKQMRRTARIEEELPSTTRQSHRQTKVTWTPRERRHAHVVPVLYRVNGVGEWLPGTSENLSRSGMLFRADFPVEPGVPVEVELEMPRELTGEAETKVICKAKVARVTHVEATSKVPESFLIACAIADYDFGKKAAERAKQEFEQRREAAKGQVHYFPRIAKK